MPANDETELDEMRLLSADQKLDLELFKLTLSPTNFVSRDKYWHNEAQTIGFSRTRLSIGKAQSAANALNFTYHDVRNVFWKFRNRIHLMFKQQDRHPFEIMLKSGAVISLAPYDGSGTDARFTDANETGIHDSDPFLVGTSGAKPIDRSKQRGF